MDGSKPYLQGPATLRSNFRNRTSNLRGSVLYVVGCRAAKTPSDEMTAPNFFAFLPMMWHAGLTLTLTLTLFRTMLRGDNKIRSMQLAKADQRRVVL